MSAASVPFGAEHLERLRLDNPHTRVVDVRSPAEFSVRHIPGSCNMPLARLDEHMADLTSPDAGPVVLVCESGGRARVAQRRLVDAGHSAVHVSGTSRATPPDRRDPLGDAPPDPELAALWISALSVTGPPVAGSASGTE